MFRKVHLYLTLMCTGVISLIMIVMTCGYLYLAEKGLCDSQYRSFQNDISTIAAGVEQQAVISMEWLSKMESRGRYLCYVLDNGVPFLYNRINGMTEESETEALLQSCLEAYENTVEYTYIEEEIASGGRYNTCFHTAFPFNPNGGKNEYYAGVIEFARGDASLQMVVLSSLEFLREEIAAQRIRFLLIDLAALAALALFSFFFTGRILRPIAENRRKQTAFVAAASHELRTPLAVILSAAECCRDVDREKRDGFLDTIKQEGDILTSLVNDMLDLSASDDQRFPVHPAPVELDTLCMNVYEAFEPLAGEKELRLAVTLPEGRIPPCTADYERLYQLLSILLSNAISYTPPGGSIVLELSYQPAHKKSRFCLTVSDTGVGIPEEDQEKIFDRFYRAEKSRSAKGHFGLGLSIALEIVKRHHGTIAVRERPGGGSVFVVTLP